MSNSRLYDELRKSSNGPRSNSQRRDFSFYQGSSTENNTSASRFRTRSTNSSSNREQVAQRRSHTGQQNRRENSGDRPFAYRQEPSGDVGQWNPPTLKEILIDLGLRMLEVAIGAAAQEVAYYFQKRRFMP